VRDPAMMSLAGIADAIRARKLSSVEATQALLGRIEKCQPLINAYVRVNGDAALQAAKAADAALAASGPRGPLHGVYPALLGRFDRTGRQRGRQQHRKPSLYDVRGKASMADAKAEETSEAVCPNSRVHALQRPPQHLRPHIDAQRDLQLRTFGRQMRRESVKTRLKVPLDGALGSLLKNGVYPVFGGWTHRLGVGAEPTV